MGGAQKKVSNPERTFSERMEPVRGQSVAWRSRYLLKTSKSSAKSSRAPHFFSWNRIFDLARFGLQELRIWLAGYPIFDLARSGLQGPRVCPAQRGTMALGDTSTLVHPGAPRGNPPVS